MPPAPSIDNLSDARWRLRNLYKIKNKAGEVIKFVPNPEQEKYLDNIHSRNLILKARQKGFTTLNCIVELDAALWEPNTSCGLIAHNEKAAEEIFRNIIKFAYDNLDESIKSRIPAKNDRTNQFVFANGSSILVATSVRSGTFQYLHISEFGKICAKYPERAKEIVTGSIETVAAGGYVCIESTAEGQQGYFFDWCQAGKSLPDDYEYTELDFKFHFFPWYESADCVLDGSFPIPREYEEYFASLGLFDLTDAQKRWYVKKDERLGSEMKREYPSTPDEAFEQAIEGAYFSRELEIAHKQGRIGMYPVVPTLPVNTFWDLGYHDYCVIWFHQQWQGMDRFVGYYENTGEKIEHYVRFLKEWKNEHDVIFGEHYAPHDIKRDDMFYDETRLEKAERLGIRFQRVRRVQDKQDAIDATRTRFATALFDKENCNQGLSRLGVYRKEWDDRLGKWKEKPRHDEASHAADALMQWSTGYIPPREYQEYERELQYDRDAGRDNMTGY